MTEAAKVTAARIEVEKRRAALMDTVHELQLRLAPRILAGEAWEKVKIKGADLAEDAVDAVAKRPVALGGVAAAIAIFFARQPIKDAAVKIYDAVTNGATKAPRPALKSSQPPVSRSAPAKPSDRPAKRGAGNTETVK